MAQQIKLPRQLYSDLISAERQLRDSFAEFDKAQSCGIDCQELRGAVEQQLAVIEQIKANYGQK